MFLTGLSLLRYSADVVLLQEMVQPYMRFMHRRLGDEYAFIEGDWLVLGVVCVTVCVSRCVSHGAVSSQVDRTVTSP